MIDFGNAGHLLQLSLGLLAGALVFAFAFMGQTRALFLLLVVMIPFQPIDSRFGSINMVLTYLVGMATFMRGGFTGPPNTRHPPLRWQYALLLLAFLVSWTFSPRMFWRFNMFYLVMVGSNVVLFYLTYAMCQRREHIEQLLRFLIASNVLVLVYCAVQVFAGFGSVSVLGVQEFTLLRNRADQRLVGPFNAVGITAEYLVLQSLILGFYFLHQKRFTVPMLLLLLGNAAVLVGTGNRGGLISAVIAVSLFAYGYRHRIGGGGLIALFALMATIMTAASVIMVRFTDFNLLFERFLGTTFEAGFVPETRSGWFDTVDRIAEKPVIGHGPRIVIPHDFGDARLRSWPDGAITYMPHNLYLYLLYTTGVLGFLAYFAWAVSYFRSLLEARKRSRSDDTLFGFATLGVIIFIVFSIDQMKVEFLRVSLLDYQHYISVLFGMFAAYAQMVLGAARRTAKPLVAQPGLAGSAAGGQAIPLVAAAVLGTVLASAAPPAGASTEAARNTVAQPGTGIQESFAAQLDGPHLRALAAGGTDGRHL